MTEIKPTLEEYEAIENDLKKTKQSLMDALVTSNIVTKMREIRPLPCNRSIQNAITNVEDALTFLHVEKTLQYPPEEPVNAD